MNSNSFDTTNLAALPVNCDVLGQLVQAKCRFLVLKKLVDVVPLKYGGLAYTEITSKHDFVQSHTLLFCHHVCFCPSVRCNLAFAEILQTTQWGGAGRILRSRWGLDAIRQEKLNFLFHLKNSFILIWVFSSFFRSGHLNETDDKK